MSEKISSFESIVQERYATKKFNGEEIPEEKVNTLLELIRFAPSSFNIQPWKIIIIKDKLLKEKLLPASYNQPQITSCSHLLIFCADLEISKKISQLHNLMTEQGINPEVIKGSKEMMTSFEKNLTPEQKQSWAQRQVYLALANALNGAKSLEFDSCPMEGFSPQAYSEILKLPQTLVPTALCPIGYASDKANPKLRFPKEEVFIPL